MRAQLLSLATLLSLTSCLAFRAELPLSRKQCCSLRTQLAMCALPEALASCRKMKVSELKAELDLRGISYVGMIEKEELAQSLAEARVNGRADPTIFDRFNQQSVEQAWSATVGSEPAEAGETADIAAADGGVPGGMDAEKLSKLTQNPELMGLLRNPKMQEALKMVMEKGPDAMSEVGTDPETREMLRKASELLKAT